MVLDDVALGREKSIKRKCTPKKGGGGVVKRGDLEE